MVNKVVSLQSRKQTGRTEQEEQAFLEEIEHLKKAEFYMVFSQTDLDTPGRLFNNMSPTELNFVLDQIKLALISQSYEDS